MATVMLMVSIESLLTSLIKKVEIIPNIIPRMMAPIVSYKNSITIYKGSIFYPFTSYKLIVSNTMHVPSLNKLSPSIRELNFLGAPAYFSKASTATVSVQDSTDPNIKASGMLKKESSNPMMYLRLIIIRIALTNTDGKAKMKIWTDCFLKMYQSELNAPSKISGGKKMISIPLGSMSDMVMMD